MPSPLPKTALANRFHGFIRGNNVCWVPLVFVWIDTLDDCDNPTCGGIADVKQAHLINGQILVIRLCFTCAAQIAVDTGMAEHVEQLAPRVAPASCILSP